MSKHHKRSILENSEDPKSSLREPCNSLSTSKTFLHSGSDVKELNLSWKKLQTGKLKGASSSSTGSKKHNAWIASSFGDFDEGNAKRTKLVNIKNSFNTNGRQLVPQKLKKDEDLWLDKYKPKSESELAVHKKKVAEVRNWLLDHLCSQSSSGAVLLLTGSAGAGKTATVHVLANELGFEVQEWINPLSETDAEGEYSNWSKSSQSQVRQFQDFILRVSKYPTLSLFKEKSSVAVKKIILVEDLPNIFFRDATKLQEVLSTYQQKGRVPIVFVISDSHHGDSNVHKLLPKDVQHKLHVHNISFNPVAHTSLVKAMNRITSLEAQQSQNKSTFMIPSKETVELLAQNSGGDIRTAINGLQFSCLKDKSYTSKRKFNLARKDESKSKRSKARTTKGEKQINSVHEGANASRSSQTSQCLVYSKENTDNNLVSETVTAIGGRDTALFLFRALGKILYCKRDPGLSDVDLLPFHLSHYARNQLLFSPEDVLDRTHLSSEVFNLYLHQNYLEFFDDIDDVVNISENFSDADYMTKEWMHQSSMREYSSCLAARGLIFNGRPGGNSSSVGRGWRPLHKPQWFDVNRKMRDGACTARDLFRGCHWPSLVLQTEIVPYLAITDVPLRTPGQISFLQVMGNFKKTKSPFRGAVDTLDEKDCGTESDDNDDDILSGSQPKGTGTQGTTRCVAEECDSQVTPGAPQDVDELIEDFDDED